MSFNAKHEDDSHPSPPSPDNSKPRSVDQNPSDDDDRPGGLKLFLIFVACLTTVFLAALDATIIATAIPTITSEFQSLDSYGWYNSAYLLTACGFQLPYGRAYTLLSTKYTFMSSVLIFEIGSAICGAAPSSIALIIGRAIAGIGASGIFGGAFIIIADATPLRKRALFNSSIGACFAIASVIGPVLGGAFTSNVTWRWCFYISLPLGGLVLVIILFFLPGDLGAKNKQSTEGLTFLGLVRKLNPVGTFILVPSVICLLLAVTWGGQTYPWSDGRIIALFVVFAVSLAGWVVLQWYQGEEATIPISVASQRTVACATVYALFSGAAFVVPIYWLPVWFQAIRQESPVTSGIDNLPTVLSVVISSLGAGGLVMAIGYYMPFILLGTILSSIGSGLLTTLVPSSSTAEWIIWQILFGAGIGMSLEQTNLATQASLPPSKIPAGTSLAVFARSLGGAISASIAQSVFQTKLSNGLASALPQLDPSVVSGSGATDLISKVRAIAGDAKVGEVLGVYNGAVTATFFVAVGLTVATIVPALGMEWRDVSKQKEIGEKADEQSDVEKGPAQESEEKPREDV